MLTADILDKLDLVNSVNIKIVGRIRTKKDNTKRPQKIKVKSISEKYERLRKAHRLHQTEEYHLTYISPDLTNEQQRNGKLLRDKLRTNNGEAIKFMDTTGEGGGEKEGRFNVNIYTQPSHVHSHHVNNLNKPLYNVNSLDESLHNVNSLNETLLNESKLHHVLKCMYTNARSIMNK